MHSDPPIPPTPVAIGERVRTARRALGLDQRDVALVANVAERTVSAIERGKPTIRLDVLLRVLDAVGLSLVVDTRR